MNFAERLKKKSQEIDECLGFRYPEPPEKIELEDVVERPFQQPPGPLFALYRSTVSGEKSVMFIGLTYQEAEQKFDHYNGLAFKKRREAEISANDKAMEYVPDAEELVFYDIVEQEKLEQRSPYYNPRPVTQYDGD